MYIAEDLQGLLMPSDFVEKSRRFRKAKNKCNDNLRLLGPDLKSIQNAELTNANIIWHATGSRHAIAPPTKLIP